MSDQQAIPQALTIDDASGVDASFPMSREGRRQAIVLLLGVISLAIFALWSLVNILQDGVSDVEWVTGAFMLAILLVSPLVAWTLLEEANTVVTTSDNGLTYRTLGGISLQYKWPDVAGFKSKQGKSKLARFFLGDDDAPQEEAVSVTSEGDVENVAESPSTLLLPVHTDPALQLKSPLVRFLHKQAYGNTIPLHSGLANRDLLINIINKNTATNS
ncbi:MAG: hypothetical protein ABJA50_07230 [Chloroflexota bacterium]